VINQNSPSFGVRKVGITPMRKQPALRIPPESFGHRLALPVALIGSLFAIALFLYAVDTPPVQALLVSLP
jgi:hypothetical protein